MQLQREALEVRFRGEMEPETDSSQLTESLPSVNIRSSRRAALNSAQRTREMLYEDLA